MQMVTLLLERTLALDSIIFQNVVETRDLASLPPFAMPQAGKNAEFLALLVNLEAVESHQVIKLVFGSSKFSVRIERRGTALTPKSSRCIHLKPSHISDGNFGRLAKLGEFVMVSPRRRGKSPSSISCHSFKLIMSSSFNFSKEGNPRI